jgi:hypothetical protein
LEVTKVKNLLYSEIAAYQQHQQKALEDQRAQQNLQFKQNLKNLSSSIRHMRQSDSSGFSLNEKDIVQRLQQMNYPNVSTQRLALTNLKQRQKSLERQIKSQTEEIERLRAKTDSKAMEDLKGELRKSYEVMLHLRKRISGQAESHQYNKVMSEIMTYLEIP